MLAGLIIGGHGDIWGAATTPMVEVTSALLIAAAPAALAIAPLAWLGRISYGVYLWHIPMLWLMRHHPRSIADGALLWSASILAGWLSHVVVERRFWRPSGRPLELDSRGSEDTRAAVEV